MRLATALLAFVSLALFASESSAQFVYVTGYAPAPTVVVAPPTVAYRPVTPVVAYSPVVAAPVVAAPVAVARPVVVGGPVVTTRYRPFLGGTVSRVRYRYAPTTVVTPLY